MESLCTGPQRPQAGPPKDYRKSTQHQALEKGLAHPLIALRPSRSHGFLCYAHSGQPPWESETPFCTTVAQSKLIHQHIQHLDGVKLVPPNSQQLTMTSASHLSLRGAHGSHLAC